MRYNKVNPRRRSYIVVFQSRRDADWQTDKPHRSHNFPALSGANDRAASWPETSATVPRATSNIRSVRFFSAAAAAARRAMIKYAGSSSSPAGDGRGLATAAAASAAYVKQRKLLFTVGLYPGHGRRRIYTKLHLMDSWVGQPTTRCSLRWLAVAGGRCARGPVMSVPGDATRLGHRSHDTRFSVAVPPGSSGNFPRSPARYDSVSSCVTKNDLTSRRKSFCTGLCDGQVF